MEPSMWRAASSAKKVLLLDVVPAMNGIAALLINDHNKLDIVPLEEFQAKYRFCGKKG